MPRPPKKTGSSGGVPRPAGAPRPGGALRPSGPPSGGGNIDRGLVRPEWRKRLEERAHERAQVREQFERPGAPPPARIPIKKAPRSKLWDPFKIWTPSPQQVEEAREEAARVSRFREAIVPEAEREHVRDQAEAWRRGERPLQTRQQQTPSYSGRYGGYQRGQTQPSAPQADPAPISITPEYVAQVFNLEKVFAHVGQLRMDPKFKASGSTGGVGIISPAGMDSWGKVLKTAEFFGIPERDIIRIPREEVWEKFMKPFLTEVERVLNSVKPKNLPGSFRFESSPSGAFGLVYSEK